MFPDDRTPVADTLVSMPLLPRPSSRWKVRFPEPTEEANPSEEGVVLRATDDPVRVMAHPGDEPLGEDGKGVLVPRGAFAVFEPEAVSQWTREWPTEEGWYWFCDMDPRQPLIVEPVRVLRLSRVPIVARGAAELPTKDYPHAWFHPMEQAPEPPVHASQEK